MIASVMPLPADPLPKRFTNIVRPDGLKQAPASSLELSRLTANSKASPPGEIPIRRFGLMRPGARGCVSLSVPPASSSHSRRPPRGVTVRLSGESRTGCPGDSKSRRRCPPDGPCWRVLPDLAVSLAKSVRVGGIAVLDVAAAGCDEEHAAALPPAALEPVELRATLDEALVEGAGRAAVARGDRVGIIDVEPGHRQDEALGLTLARVVLRLAGDAEHLEQTARLEIGRIVRQVAVEA